MPSRSILRMALPGQADAGPSGAASADFTMAAPIWCRCPSMLGVQNVPVANGT